MENKSIIVLYRKLRKEANFCHLYLPREIMLSETEIESLKSLSNQEIDLEFIYKFYFLADICLTDMKIDRQTQQSAELLKKLCKEEICTY